MTAKKIPLISTEPTAENVTKTERRVLEVGYTYLVKEEKPEKSFHAFVDAVNHGAPGLCITRINPDKVREKYGLSETPILWLTDMRTEKPSISPSELEHLSSTIGDFTNKAENGTILIDGLECLISNNTFRDVAHLVENLRDVISVSKSCLIIPINSRVLKENELKFLERELESEKDIFRNE